MNNQQENLRNDIRKVIAVVFGLILIGIVFVSVQQWEKGKPSTAILWALACLASGTLIGFLFGIPKILQGDAANSPLAAAASGVGSSTTPLYRSQVNTNLEQVSDWLTKIFVGLGLVQLQQFPAKLKGAAQFVAYGLGGDEYQVFAGALIIYFSIVGFMGGYLITRLFLAPVFGRADNLPLDDQSKDALINSDLSFGANRSSLTAMARAAASKILSVPLEQLTALSDISAWAKAQLSAGNYDSAIAGYQKVVQLSPQNVQLRLEYANALYKATRPRTEIEQQLLEAYKIVRATPQIDSVTKMKVYRALTYHYLFAPPPDGFLNAINYGQEYLRDPDSQKIKSGGLFVNLACAYAQQYKWLREHEHESDNSPKLEEARKNALEFIQRALDVDPVWRDRLRTLLRTDIQKPADDNDLEVFEKDNTIRELLGLPPVIQ